MVAYFEARTTDMYVLMPILYLANLKDIDGNHSVQTEIARFDESKHKEEHDKLWK